MNKTVAVSGYFTILHKGHIRLFKDAKALGDKLVVIINNNAQQIAKKGKLIHDTQDIKEVISHLRMVDEVVIAVDEDSTVCKTLELVKPDIFANGGDRNKANVPEDVVCEKYNIQMIDNIGKGGKVDSSSRLIEKVGL